MSDTFSQRFGGIQRLYGLEASAAIRQAHIAVVGVGGVGSWAAEALARSGVGEITLIDMDDICISNSNRQIQALTSTVGKAKIDVLCERIAAINPDCVVHGVLDFLVEENLPQYLSASFDVVLDCIDSVPAKAAIIAACKRQKIPVITAGGAGGQIDPQKILVADLAKSFQDPLLAQVKSRLRRFYGFAKGEKAKFGVECVFSSEQLMYPQPDGSVCAQKAKTSDGESMRLDCNAGFGASVMVTGSFGFFMAARAIAKITQKKA